MNMRENYVEWTAITMREGEMGSQWELMEDISSHLQYSQEEVLLIFEDRYYTTQCSLPSKQYTHSTYVNCIFKCLFTSNFDSFLRLHTLLVSLSKRARCYIHKGTNGMGGRYNEESYEFI